MSASIRTKAIWLIYSHVDLSILNTYINATKTWSDLGKPSFFEKLSRFKFPRTRIAFGRLSNLERDELKRLYKVLIYIRDRVSFHKRELGADKQVLKEANNIREEIRRKEEAAARLAEERRKYHREERRHREHMGILKNNNNNNNDNNDNNNNNNFFIGVLQFAAENF